MVKIKYEPVFGDQSLFDNAIGDSVAAINHGDVVYCFNSYNAFLIEVMKCNDLPPSYIPEFAMRRIIKTPVWTKADKDAGRLPEVGAKYLAGSGRQEFTCLFNGKGGYGSISVIGFNADNEVMGYLPEYCYPIETTEDRAQRLRSEWCANVRKNYPAHGHVTVEAAIYDALLSGELKAPEVE